MRSHFGDDLEEGFEEELPYARGAGRRPMYVDNMLEEDDED